MKYTNSLALFLTLALPLTAGCKAQSIHEATDNGVGSSYSASSGAPAHLSPAKAQGMVGSVTMGKKVSADGDMAQADQANKFGPGEPIYVALQLGAPAGSTVKVAWLDPSNKKLAEDQKTVAKHEKGMAFQAKDAASWATGDYSVEVWIGDQKVSTQQFTIADKNS
jgi:hypothetical protein